MPTLEWTQPGSSPWEAGVALAEAFRQTKIGPHDLKTFAVIISLIGDGVYEAHAEFTIHWEDLDPELAPVLEEWNVAFLSSNAVASPQEAAAGLEREFERWKKQLVIPDRTTAYSFSTMAVINEDNGEQLHIATLAIFYDTSTPAAPMN